MLSFIEKKQDYNEDEVKELFEQRVHYLVEKYQEKKYVMNEKRDAVEHKLQNV